MTQVVVEGLRPQARVGVRCDPPAEEHRDLGRVADRAVEVEGALAQAVQGRTLLKDEVGAGLDLADEEAVAEPLVAAVAAGEVGDQLGQPAVAAGLDVRRREPVGQLLEPRRAPLGGMRISPWCASARAGTKWW